MEDEPTDAASVLLGLENLAKSLKSLNDTQSAPHLSHFRQVPESVTSAYDFLRQGASLCHGTSTKYTLMGKIDEDKANEIVVDLLKGCQLVATGCLVLHQDSIGCSRSVRHSVKQAGRAIVSTVSQLVEAFVNHSATATSSDGEHPNNVGAQRTGAVWQTCDAVAKLPVGNRNAMRRDLFTYVAECNESMNEFQELIDLGPSLAEERGASTEESWDDFLTGQSDQYSADEIPVAAACLFLIKCSRGSMNVLLKACEQVGSLLEEGEHVSESTQQRLDWMSRAHDLGRAVGDGMTDLGANLYPPLQRENLEPEIMRQGAAIEALVDYVLDCTEIEGEPRELATSIQSAIRKRQDEAIEALRALGETETEDEEEEKDAPGGGAAS